MIKDEAVKAIKSHCYFANLVPVGKEALDMAIKALEYESVLSKIKDETMKFQKYKMFVGESMVYVDREDVLQIIDKYKAESEDT